MQYVLTMNAEQAEHIVHALDNYIPREALSQRPVQMKVAHDLMRVLRRAIAKQQGYPLSSVWHNPPLHFARDVPLATCEVIESEAAK